MRTHNSKFHNKKLQEGCGIKIKFDRNRYAFIKTTANAIFAIKWDFLDKGMFFKNL
jgi:hypothetical protein